MASNGRCTCSSSGCQRCPWDTALLHCLTLRAFKFCAPSVPRANSHARFRALITASTLIKVLLVE